jgi:hypothetical protein
VVAGSMDGPAWQHRSVDPRRARRRTEPVRS